MLTTWLAIEEFLMDYIFFFIPCLKKHSQSEARLLLHILRYATGNILLYFSVVTCMQQLCWGPFEDFSKPAPKHFNYSTITFCFQKFSENFKKS